ncbi:unnamed protein product [Symbiodinium sp. CCMP2592]|nr:unnamed protein product [Symbiodinium sp. CCMP2592]
MTSVMSEASVDVLREMLHVFTSRIYSNNEGQRFGSKSLVQLVVGQRTSLFSQLMLVLKGVGFASGDTPFGNEEDLPSAASPHNYIRGRRVNWENRFGAMAQGVRGEGVVTELSYSPVHRTADHLDTHADPMIHFSDSGGKFLQRWQDFVNHRAELVPDAVRPCNMALYAKGQLYASYKTQIESLITGPIRVQGLYPGVALTPTIVLPLDEFPAALRPDFDVMLNRVHRGEAFVLIAPTMSEKKITMMRIMTSGAPAMRTSWRQFQSVAAGGPGANRQGGVPNTAMMFLESLTMEVGACQYLYILSTTYYRQLLGAGPHAPQQPPALGPNSWPTAAEAHRLLWEIASDRIEEESAMLGVQLAMAMSTPFAERGPNGDGAVAHLTTGFLNMRRVFLPRPREHKPLAKLFSKERFTNNGCMTSTASTFNGTSLGMSGLPTIVASGLEVQPYYDQAGDLHGETSGLEFTALDGCSLEGLCGPGASSSGVSSLGTSLAVLPFAWFQLLYLPWTLSVGEYALHALLCPALDEVTISWHGAGQHVAGVNVWTLLATSGMGNTMTTTTSVLHLGSDWASSHGWHTSWRTLTWTSTTTRTPLVGEFGLHPLLCPALDGMTISWHGAGQHVAGVNVWTLLATFGGCSTMTTTTTTLLMGSDWASAHWWYTSWRTLTWTSTTTTTSSQGVDAERELAASLTLESLIVEPNDTSLLMQLSTGAGQAVTVRPTMPSNIGMQGVDDFLASVLQLTLREMRSKLGVGHPPVIRWAIYGHLRLIQTLIVSLQAYREEILRGVPVPPDEPRTPTRSCRLCFLNISKTSYGVEKLMLQLTEKGRAWRSSWRWDVDGKLALDMWFQGLRRTLGNVFHLEQLGRCRMHLLNSRVRHLGRDMYGVVLCFGETCHWLLLAVFALVNLWAPTTPLAMLPEMRHETGPSMPVDSGVGLIPSAPVYNPLAPTTPMEAFGEVSASYIDDFLAGVDEEITSTTTTTSTTLQTTASTTLQMLGGNCDPGMDATVLPDCGVGMSLDGGEVYHGTSFSMSHTLLGASMTLTSTTTSTSTVTSGTGSSSNSTAGRLGLRERDHLIAQRVAELVLRELLHVLRRPQTRVVPRRWPRAASKRGALPPRRMGRPLPSRAPQMPSTAATGSGTQGGGSATSPLDQVTEGMGDFVEIEIPEEVAMPGYLVDELDVTEGMDVADELDEQPASDDIEGVADPREYSSWREL